MKCLSWCSSKLSICSLILFWKIDFLLDFFLFRLFSLITSNENIHNVDSLWKNCTNQSMRLWLACSLTNMETILLRLESCCTIFHNCLYAVQIQKHFQRLYKDRSFRPVVLIRWKEQLKSNLKMLNWMHAAEIFVHFWNISIGDNVGVEMNLSIFKKIKMESKSKSLQTISCGYFGPCLAISTNWVICVSISFSKLFERQPKPNWRKVCKVNRLCSCHKSPSVKKNPIFVGYCQFWFVITT